MRYTDHERAVIWLETVTPAMVQRAVSQEPASPRRSSGVTPSTVRVGGRYFAAVEIDGLDRRHFYEYTLELAPLPAAGKIPTEQPSSRRCFRTLTTAVQSAMRSSSRRSSLARGPWLTFRTLRRSYKDRLRFATGSCRWYPGDTSHKGKDWARHARRSRRPG